MVECDICKGIKTKRIGSGFDQLGHEDMARKQGWKNEAGSWICPACQDPFDYETFAHTISTTKNVAKVQKKLQEFAAHRDQLQGKIDQLTSEIEIEPLETSYDKLMEMDEKRDREIRKLELVTAQAKKLQKKLIQAKRADIEKEIEKQHTEWQNIQQKLQGRKKEKERIQGQLDQVNIEIEQSFITMNNLGEETSTLSRLISK